MTEDLIVRPAVVFDLDPFLEAKGDGPAKKAQKAGRASNDVLNDRVRLEKETAEQLLKRLNALKAGLAKRLLADTGGLTDFRRFNLNTLLADVDRLIVDTTAGLATDAQGKYQAANDLGIDAIDEPIKSVGLTINPALPGLDSTLVQAAFGNTVDLLTPPMQQFGSQVKMAVRAVSLAGDSKMGAIIKLRDQIAGAGFNGAAYKAERIIRTELGRTFNSATFDRITLLAKEFPFLRKGWRAAKDNRTRQGHVEAGRKYTRGAGSIPVSQHFSLNVYDERPGKNMVLIGVCLLRFPVDPLAVPAGRVSAGATILCRCNAFVDFLLEAFAAFAKTQVSVIVPGVPATGEPVDVPGDRRKKTPKPKMQNKPAGDPHKALGQSLKTTLNHYGGTFYTTQQAAIDLQKQLGRGTVVKGSRGFFVQDGAATFGPGGWKAGVKVPTAKQVTPKPAVKGPAGPSTVSAAMQVEKGYERIGTALKVIDQVHGSDALPKIPVGPVPKRFQSKAKAGYLHGRDGTPMGLVFGRRLLKATPHMSTFHEVGHYLDHQGLGRRTFASQMPKGTNTELGQAMDTLRQAFRDSAAIQKIRQWHEANLPQTDFAGRPQNVGGHKYGDGTVPQGVNRKFTTYLLSAEETFARGYAQYVATRSGDPAALKELKAMQTASAAGMRPVAKTDPYNGNSLTDGQLPVPGSWDYPWQWSDEDFKPIAAAYDQIMEVMGWRK